MRVCLLGVLLRLALGDRAAPRFRVDLGVDPEHRWDHILATQGEAVKEVLHHILSLPELRSVAPLAERLVGNELEARRILPGTQYEETRGIARALDINPSELVLTMAFYDLFAADKSPFAFRACTGIVAESSAGEIVHGRNLDYMFKSDLSKITWVVDFVRGNSTVFTAVTFGPVPAFHTAVKYGVVSVSQNERDAGSWLENIFDLLVRGRRVLSGRVREAMETVESFEQAVDFFSGIKLSAASYFILGGVMPGEGAVITRDRGSAADVWRLDAQAGRWYVLETNYDHTSAPPAGDDRRDPLIRALNSTGRAGMTSAAMWRIIETTRVNSSAGERSPLNSETIYSTVMRAADPSSFRTVVRSRDASSGGDLLVV